MNCWKTIDFKKEYGLRWLRFISWFTGLLAFILLYVPTTIAHGGNQVNELGILYLIIALILLPPFNSLMHILPLLLSKRKVKLIDKRKSRIIPLFTRYPRMQLTKVHFLMVAFAPTFFITIPGIILSFLVPEFYVYILLYTSIHIGITFIDFIYIFHISRAPKHSIVEKGTDGFDILLKAPH
ncbi:Putative zincin peptidase [Oceanobacillus limi]|uniref:Putative zincin peptidase n=1 Tax=Oceanobacillus limi TaxID=930131 RepID=A0A1H9YKS1_9BACI|nr:DUF3267 domain-containing protein [Oceanobacillus limi]SES69609.1 Putative zincin peptidase [Oceanobacillus limi]